MLCLFAEVNNNAATPRRDFKLRCKLGFVLLILFLGDNILYT
jgi:hypothetical protein